MLKDLHGHLQKEAFFGYVYTCTFTKHFKINSTSINTNYNIYNMYTYYITTDQF